MVTSVYVSPWEMVRAICADFGAPEGNEDRYHVVEGPNVVTGKGSGKTITICLNFLSDVAPSRSINLIATGERHIAEGIRAHTALQSLMQSIWELYGIYPADFSYVLMSEKRVTYDRMNRAIDHLLCIYQELEREVDSSYAATQNMCRKLASWLYINRSSLSESDTMTIEGFWACITDFNATMSSQIQENKRMISLLKFKNTKPDDYRWFSELVPMPMEVNWERCYHLIKCIFDQASTKLGCNDYGINVVRTTDGNFRGVIQTDDTCFHFEGDVANSELAAKAKVIFGGIRYVKHVLHYGILDANYQLLHHEEKFINEFTDKLVALHACADRLQNRILGCYSIIEENKKHVAKHLLITGVTTAAVEIIIAGVHEQNNTKTKCDEAWSCFIPMMESRKGLVHEGIQAANSQTTNRNI